MNRHVVACLNLLKWEGVVRPQPPLKCSYEPSPNEPYGDEDKIGEQKRGSCVSRIQRSGVTGSPSPVNRRRNRTKIRNVLIMQVKDLSGPRAITQTGRDREEYIRYFLEEKPCVILIPIFFARGLSKSAGKQVVSYGVNHYRPDEIDDLLR